MLPREDQQAAACLLASMRGLFLAGCPWFGSSDNMCTHTGGWEPLCSSDYNPPPGRLWTSHLAAMYPQGGCVLLLVTPMSPLNRVPHP